MIEKLKYLTSHHGFIKYSKNTLWLFGEKILLLILGLFVGIWMARYLGPEQFGLFSYVLSFVGIFTVMATLGLESIMVRELVRDENITNELISTAFWLIAIGALVVLFILSIAINFTSNDLYTNYLMYIVASATIFQSFKVVDFYFQAKVKSKYTVIVNSLCLIISGLIKIIFILNEFPLIAFAWVVLFDSFMMAVTFTYVYVKYNSKFSIDNIKFIKSVAIDLLRDSWPLVLSGVAVTIYMKIDQIMIKEMLNIEAVGQYAAAVRLSEAWYFIPIVVASSLFPAIINAKKVSEEFYYRRLQKLYDLMVWIAIAIAIPVSFLSDWIVGLLYGEQYNQAGSVLTIHIWAGIFVFLGVAFSKYLVNENQTKKSLYRVLLGLIFNVLFNFILIPKYGINGAAIAVLLGQFIANYVYDLFDKSLHQQFKMKTKSFLPMHIFKGY